MKTLGIIVTLANIICLVLGIIDIAIIDIPIVHGGAIQIYVSCIGTICGGIVIWSEL